MNRIEQLALLVGCTTLVLLITACGGVNSTERQRSMLDEFHTTCLKSGLAVDTNEHIDCVVALYEARQRQQARLQSIVIPAKAAGTGSNYSQNQ